MNTSDFAQIYVACALTNVDESARRTLQRDCAAIVDAVHRTASDESWRVVAYDPITHTPPWQDQGRQFSSEEVWMIDTTKVLEEADAIIIHGFQGGSIGVGLELALAFGRGIPVLYVHHDSCEVTKMVKGMPGLVEVAPFFDYNDQEDDRARLRQVVTEWLQKWRPVIEDGPASRRSIGQLFLVVQQALAARWERMSARERALAAFAARMTVSEADEYLRSGLRLGFMPTAKLMLLGSSMGERVPHLLAPHLRPPPLSRKEADALNAACDEYEWGDLFKQTIENVARVHKESVGRNPVVARVASHYNFWDPAEWVRFVEDWQRGTVA